MAKNGSTSTMAPSTGPSHPYERMMIDRQQTGEPLMAPTLPISAGIGMPAVPITVTTASHPDPAVGGGLSSSQRQNLRLASAGGAVPLKQFLLPAVKLAGPKGGFTLPCEQNAAAVSPPAPIAPKPTAIKKSASAMPLMHAYSAASIASIQAQGDSMKTHGSLGRRSQSAPNTVVLAHHNSKYKYRKVVGGKVPTGSTAVSLLCD